MFTSLVKIDDDSPYLTPFETLIASSKSPLAVVHYPDSGKLGVWTQGEGYEAMVRAEPQLDYWEGE